MGWTSIGYYKATHDEFSEKNLKQFLEDEYINRGINFAIIHMEKGDEEHHIYCLARNYQSSKPFIFVIILHIRDNNLTWKDILESDGPRPQRCPKEYFRWLPTPPNDIAKAWRESCIKEDAQINQIHL